MRILHFIPDITDNRDVKKEFFRHLMNMSDNVEMRILTTDGDIGLDNAEKVSRIIPILGKKIEKTLNVFHPDIIHIHGCTGRAELKVLNIGEKYHTPIIVSPSGSLAAITLTERSTVKQLTSEASRARKLISQADAVHVTGELEMQAVNKLQIIPGKELNKDINRKTLMIKNSVLTNAITDDEMRNSFIQLYKKVIWKRSYDTMLPETKECEKLLLRKGFSGEFFKKEDKDEQLARDISNDELEKIFIHAEIENVRDYIIKGCHEFGLPYSSDPEEYRIKAGLGEINEDMQLFNDIEKIKSKNKKILRDFENYNDVVELFCIIDSAQNMLHKGTLTYRHLTNISDTLINNDYREDIVLKLFKDSKIYDFAARLMYVMNEYTGLPEGFMPVVPINDNKTKNIITFLTLKSR